MATNTKNYNLVKPAENELADISVLNKNMDVIDEQMLPVNGLNSVDSKKPLAAAQGKVLNEKIGDLSTLNTEHKENLVQAINEAADGAGITVVTESEYKDMQKAGTVDADKLYGIVDSYDSSAGNVGISDTLSAKLGLSTEKNVEKAIDSVDTKASQNVKDISEVNRSLSNAIMKDGSVQMTGVLKLLADVATTREKLNLGKASINTDANGTFTIHINSYTNDGGATWYRKDVGTAMAINVYQSGYADLWTAVTGAKDSVLTWVYVGTFLTTATGLPLTGGTLSGDINIQRLGYPTLYLSSGTTNCAYIQKVITPANVDTGTCITDKDINANISQLYIKAYDSLHNALMLWYRNGGYNVYHTGNITVSTAAPSSTLAEGAQHQVYA